DPLIHKGCVLALAKHHFLEFEWLTAVEFEPDQFVLVAGHGLPVQIMQAVKAFAHAPIEQDDAELAARLRAIENTLRAGHGALQVSLSPSPLPLFRGRGAVVKG